MPSKPLKPCATVGCGELVKQGHARCSTHNQERQRWARNDSDAQAFYHSAPWRRVRSNVLRSAGGLCVNLFEGCTMIANQVDHIKPMTKGGERLSIDNLQALCINCHSFKTIKENPIF